MRRSRALPVFALLLATSSPARAETTGEAPPAPRWFPGCDATAGGAEIDALTRAGRKKVDTGAALMILGTTFAVVGTGLLIASWRSDGSYGLLQPGLYAHLTGQADEAVSSRDVRFEQTVLTNVGVGAIFLGLALASPGTHLYVDGRDDLDTARRERARLRRLWSFAPLTDRSQP